MTLKVEHARLVTPEKITEDGTLYIRDGIFTAPFSGPYDCVVDAQNLAVFPGFIDAHTHLRDPGFEYKEDIESGTAAAVAGGFTSVACMPNTLPVIDNASVVRYILEKAAAVGHCNVFPIGACSKNMEGELLSEIGLMKAAGIVALSDDGKPVSTAELMKKVMRYAADFDLTVIDHCEDASMADGVMNEGLASLEMGVRGIPSIAEDIHVARDLALARYLDLPVHIAHVSTKGAIDMIRQAKADGVKVTCETCPHYFVLTDDDCRGFDALCRVNPPLRRPEDRTAVIEALKDGTIDMIVTDHAPHHDDEKNIEFSMAKNGMTGLETAFSLAYTHLVLTGHLSLQDLCRLLTEAPNDLLKIGRGSFSEGAPADFTLIDLDGVWTVDRFHQHSKAHNTPFHGHVLNGVVKATYVNGHKAYPFKQ